MSLEEQLIGMIKDRFDAVDAKLDQASEAFKEHTARDEHYWKKIDQQEAQIGMIKWMGSGLSGSAILAFLYDKFGR